jgi:phage tail sheath gpL-like
MTLFSRKDGDGEKTPKRRAGDLALVEGAGGVPAHRLTMDMARAESLAAMMAHSRAATVVEVADLLAGMYMYEWDRLAKYWDDEEKVESYLQQICRISPQRWHYWIEFHHRQLAAENEPKKWKLPLGGKKEKDEVEVPKLGYSAELQAIWAAAEAAAPTTDIVDGLAIPVLTLECVLFAIASRTNSEIGHRLVAAGLKLQELETEARRPRHAPR